MAYNCPHSTIIHIYSLIFNPRSASSMCGPCRCKAEGVVEKSRIRGKYLSTHIYTLLFLFLTLPSSTSSFLSYLCIILWFEIGGLVTICSKERQQKMDGPLGTKHGLTIDPLIIGAGKHWDGWHTSEGARRGKKERKTKKGR